MGYFDNPEPLDQHQYRGRTFDRASLPIVFPRSWGRNGDYMMAFKLALGLQHELQCNVKVLVGQSDDFEKFASLSNELHELGAYAGPNNSVHIKHVPMERIYRDTQDANVALWYCFPNAILEWADNDFYQGQPFFQLMSAKYNIYVSEGDVRSWKRNPFQMDSGRPYVDNAGNNHLILETGFDKDGMGILTSNVPALPNRESLLEKMFGTDYDRCILEKDWTLSYTVTESGSGDYIGLLERHIVRDTVVFDFNVDQSQELEKIEISAKSGCNMVVYKIGFQKNDVFQGLLAHADLPVLITGDASLSEAISHDKLFLYDSPRWKKGFSNNVLDFAVNHLTHDELAALAPVFGFSKNAPFSLLTTRGLDEFKDVHVPVYQYVLKRAKELSDVRSKKGIELLRKTEALSDSGLSGDERYTLRYFYDVNDKRSQRSILAHKLRREKIPYTSQLFQFLQRHHMWWNEQSTDEFYWSQMIQSFVRSDYKCVPTPAALLTDPLAQEAFHKLNSTVRKKHNLVKNLADIVRDARSRI